MFDISWTEFLLIGVVALIVIGPKELPGVMRTFGQWTRKVRGMAADFQNQFHEAMREAEMADLKKQVDDMAQDFKSIDPLKGVRDDVESAGRDIHQSLHSVPDEKPALPETAAAPDAQGQALEATEQTAEPPATPALESAVPVAAVERNELDAVGAAPDATPAEPEAAPAESTGHSA